MNKLRDRIYYKLGPNGIKGFLKTKIKILLHKLCILINENKKTTVVESSDNIGIVFIVFGKKYVDEAVYSAKVIKEKSNLSVTIFCDELKDEDKIYFDFINIIEPNHVRAKIDYLEQTPYEKTLYIDSDTKVTEDLSYLFRILNKYDVAMAHDFARKRDRWSQIIPEYSNIPEGFSEFGGGVILYHKLNAKEFLELWKYYFYKYYDKTNGWDQASLRVASWETSSTIYVLPPEYNVRGQNIRDKIDNLPEHENNQHPLRPRILHWHGLNDPTCTIKPYQI